MDGDWCSLDELGPLSKLRVLEVSELENVPTTSYAANAMLDEKMHLIRLILNCTSKLGDDGLVKEKEGVSEKEQQRIEKVFDKLSPPPGIEILGIKGRDEVHLVDLAWLPRLSVLTHLDLSFVDLSPTRDWVHMFNMLPSLKVPRLVFCGLSSTVCASNLHSKSNLTHLEVLDMPRNYFFGTSFKHNWICNLTSLKELYLIGCGWNGSIPNELRNMKSLQVLNLGWNNLEGLLPTNLEDLCDLKVLKLDANNINANMGEFLDRLPRCSQNTLQELSLAETNMTRNLPVWIGNMTNLSVLQASSNMLTGPLPIGVRALGNLEFVDLIYNNFNGMLLQKHFARLLNLEYLDLSYNSLKLAINQKWVPPFRLKFASFRSCDLGPHFPEWLKWQSGIDVLVLGNSNLDDVIPDWFWVTFSQASFLHAAGNKLHGSLPENLQHMVADHIYLGSNKLTGQVPLLPINISRLNLSSNSFSGSLPSNLKAPLLEELLLANNQIRGICMSRIVLA
ncbi:receptor-like protein EIX2 [Triticum aestivum]|uniref:receptor-like protein EIX2 n=1 Tax=Triticum aestivum TaxID=4565 RepID=UPI001D0121DA|nr:receptor-like protein EIX2 [Triticum aestivum]